MHVQGQNRDQGTLFPDRLDDVIGEDNPIRVIDVFVDSLDLLALGFLRVVSEATGRPPYHPGDLLKLYLYGYQHQVRSSRRLERECQRNIEVMWLLNRLAPDFKTIANFRADNRKALTRVCRAFVQFCRSQDLYGGLQVAIDGSKFRADNNPTKRSHRRELKQQLNRLDRRIETWLDGMNANDDDDEPPSGGATRAALEALEAERETLTKRISEMDEAGLEVQPDTDREARLMKGGIGYNVQSVVDGKHHLIVDVDVVQDGYDQRQLYRMARRSQVQLGGGKMDVLADGGYSNAKLLRRCQDRGLRPSVPVQRSVNSRGDYFDKSAFRYDSESDSYACPAGQQLPKKTKSSAHQVYLYTTEACASCEIRAKCTGSKQRWVSRHFEEAVLGEVARRVEADPSLMRRRKGMVEHPFGTLKRRMDGGRFLLRGLEKVKAEMALAVTAYNLTRAINVMGTKRLCQALIT